MNKKLLKLILPAIIILLPFRIYAEPVNFLEVFSNVKSSLTKTNDPRIEETKHQYKVLKEDEKNKYIKKVLNRKPSGYMTVEEYEKMSEYKGRANQNYEIPKVELPSDFKYVPHPQYAIVKYNSPAGSAELSLGKKLYRYEHFSSS